MKHIALDTLGCVTSTVLSEIPGHGLTLHYATTSTAVTDFHHTGIFTEHFT